MAKYDYSKCDADTLNCFFESFAQDCDSNSTHTLFHVLSDKARVRTRAEYDADIAAIVRGEVKPPHGVNYWDWAVFNLLVKASKRSAGG